MFEGTVLNELAMTHKMNTILSLEGIACANTPLGWCEYAISPDAPFPSVKRCCGIFSTLGDRRLGDHVLRGLELLLPSIVVMDRLSPASLAACIPGGVFGARPQDGATWAEGDSTHMQLLCGALDSPDILASVQTLPLPLSVPADMITACPALAAEWAADSSLLGALFHHFGTECGRTMRAMQAARVSWGSFSDATGTHCNAHSNNFALVTLDRSAAPRALLAPLDFDFAYDAALGEAALGAGVAADLLALEPRALAMDLGCSPDSTGSKNDHVVPPALHGLRWALRDTLVRGYLAALHGAATPDHDGVLGARYAAVCELLELSARMTADLVA